MTVSNDTAFIAWPEYIRIMVHKMTISPPSTATIYGQTVETGWNVSFSEVSRLQEGYAKNVNLGTIELEQGNHP